MINFAEIDERGWTGVKGVVTTEDLIDVAHSLGNPIPSLTGKLVKQLTVVEPSDARPATFSATHGSGMFPLHTDTAFWPKPARYIVLRAQGDIRRPTLIKGFSEVFAKVGIPHCKLIDRSIWLLRTPTSSNYCSMKFSYDSHIGYRYDPNCMSPVNSAAIQIVELFHEAMQVNSGNMHVWSVDSAVIIANWTVLHGRGQKPPSEHTRIVERVYVS